MKNKNVITKQLLRLLSASNKKRIEVARFYLRNPRLLYNKKSPNFYPSAKVVLSFPRSGSSWVGSIIGQAMDACYLREPVTTNYQFVEKQLPSVFCPEKAKYADKYDKFFSKALNGQFSPLKNIVAFPSQWLSMHESRHLVIKEVNPLYVEAYAKYAPKIAYLLRHPYAVAKSYNALNWQQQDIISSKLSTDELAHITAKRTNLLSSGFWEQIGYLQGWIESRTRHNLLAQEAKVFVYEQICREPLDEFRHMFGFLGLDWTKEIERNILATFDEGNNPAAGDFTLTRAKSTIGKIKVRQEDRGAFSLTHQSYCEAIDDYNNVFNTNFEPTYASPNVYTTYE